MASGPATFENSSKECARRTMLYDSTLSLAVRINDHCHKHVCQPQHANDQERQQQASSNDVTVMREVVKVDVAEQ